MRPKRLFFRIGLCAALISGLFITGGAAAHAECANVWVEAYDVKLAVGRQTYRFGDTATVDGTVTRKDTGTPVDGVRFVVVAWNSREGYVFGYEDTDASGRATARLKLEKGRLKPGAVRLRAFAYKQTGEPSVCAEVSEYGEKRVRKGFVVKP